MKFLDPKVDIAFKKVFGSSHHQNLTMSFLNSVLNLSGDAKIDSVTFLETEIQPARLKGKKNFFDIHCTDQRKHEFIIEIQLLNEFNFIPRSEYYVARALALQLHKGKNYQDLLPVIFLGIVDYNLFDELDDDQNQVFSSYSMRHDVTGKQLKNTRMFLHYIELVKFTKTLEQLKTVADQWLYFLKHADTLDDVPQSLVGLQEAFTILDELQWDKLDLQEYSQEQEAIDRARRQQEGAVQEKAEKIALNLLQNGMGIEFVVQVTGLSVQHVQELQSSPQKAD
jgi:predicted transposase/invertase (TIGR01784 family)